MCVKGAVLELRGDIARIFGFLNNTTIRAFDKKGFTLALPKTGNQYFYVYTDIIKSQYHGDVVVPVLRTVTVKGKQSKESIQLSSDSNRNTSQWRRGPIQATETQL